MLAAIAAGVVRVYSSDPIGPGVFVTPSRMEAESYAETGAVYTDTVDVGAVAWIDPTQGQMCQENAADTSFYRQ